MSTDSTHWFWGALARQAPLYGHVAVASFMVNLLGLAMPLFIMNVYDRVVPNSAFESLWVLASGVVLAVGLDFALRAARIRFVDMAGRNADVLLLGRFMDALLDTRLDATPAASVGGLAAKVREFEHVREFLGSTTLLTLLDFPFVLLFMGGIFLLGGPLVAIPLLAAPCMAAFAWGVQWPFRRAAERQIHHTARKHALLGEVAAGFETIRAARLERALARRWDVVVDEAAAAAVQSRIIGSLAAHSALCVNALLTATLVVAGVYRIAEGLMSMGALIACVILLGRCMGPLSGLVTIINNLHKTRLALSQMQTLLQLPMENPPRETPSGQEEEAHAVTSIPVDIRLEHVSFRYPGQDSHALALRDINLHIRQGERIAVIGPTGSGKSSLARICAGLFLPTEGRMLMGNVDIRHVPMRTARRRMGVLPQATHLFSGTVRDNIRMAWPDDVPCDDDTLTDVAELAGVMDFARLHPLGLDMPVGEQGRGLSGGQAQAVCLVRALVGNPHLVILDEPTSNLDGAAEERLRVRLTPFLAGRTFIVFTHRLSMLRLVNRVVVLDNGRIVRDGPVQDMVKLS